MHLMHQRLHIIFLVICFSRTSPTRMEMCFPSSQLHLPGDEMALLLNIIISFIYIVLFD